MSQTRYERLKSNSSSQQEDRATVRRTSFTTRYNNNSDVDDNDNEDIELGGTEHRLRYHETLDNDGIEDVDNMAHLHESRNNGKANNSNVRHEITTNMAGSHIMQMAIGTLAIILLYLTLSISLTFYQKWVIKELGFPLTIVCYHLVVKFMLAAIVRAIARCHSGKTRVQLDWRVVVRKMMPTGIVSGIDIGFSNWGLKLVSISLYTMTKSSTIVFILFFAILLGLERRSLSLAFIVGLIASGLFMFTYKSTQFNPLGFVFLLVASLSSGVRWSFAQFIMQKTKLGLHNPLDMIYYMQPWMVLAVLPLMITIEAQDLYNILRDWQHISSTAISMVFFKVTLGAMLAFLMEISEFLVLSKTSSLTLSISGIFKDICQLALAVEFNNDQLSLINVLGLVVCLAGICCHLLHKYATLTKLEDLHACAELSLEGDDEMDLHFHELPRNNTNSGAVSAQSSVAALLHNKHSAQTVPLLEQSDSDDDSTNDTNDQSASDVIFDVLKRRDMQR